jgi:hypothetical protein
VYNFILNQWIMRKIDAVKVNSYVPKWITAEQAGIILATPQVSQ